MSGKDNIIEAKKIFSDYLNRKKYRKTPERFTILEEIYKRKDHFDAEKLYAQIKKKKYGISRATVYNTLDLLTSCDLVIKHQFRKNLTQYEKSYGFKQHDHIICQNCNKVMEFCDPRIQPIKKMMGELYEMEIVDHALILFGVCNGCKEKDNK